MQKLLGFAGMLLFFTITAYSQSLKPPVKTVKGKLIWSDEFNYRGLPDPAKWDYEEGFIRNEEKQFYTRERLENVSVKGGKLIIESRKEKWEEGDYTSGSINTLGKQSFTGDFRIEVRAKLPSGKGIWPAIWMMGVNRFTEGYPECSEIDIMEFVGHSPGVIHGAFHWLDSAGQNAGIKSRDAKVRINNLHSRYHVYGLERIGEEIALFVDDHRYLEFTVPQSAYPGSFTSPLYLLINTAIGGTWSREIDDHSLPQKFFIDYVRVFDMDKL